MAQEMKTHHFDNNTYAVFEAGEKGGVWMMQFIWGKKDFRIYLGRKGDQQGQQPGGPVLGSDAAGELLVTRLQYLHAFEWYDYVKVAGHGLVYEEVLWRKAKVRRYVELPKDFFDVAVRVACAEFGLEPQRTQLAS